MSQSRKHRGYMKWLKVVIVVVAVAMVLYVIVLGLVLVVGLVDLVLEDYGRGWDLPVWLEFPT